MLFMRKNKLYQNIGEISASFDAEVFWKKKVSWKSPPASLEKKHQILSKYGISQKFELKK